MAHTHEYDCKICGAHLDSKQELDRHNQEHHSRNASSGSDISSRSSGSSGSNRSS